MFSPIDFLRYRCKALPKYGKIQRNLFDFSASHKESNTSSRSKTDSTLHLELPNTEYPSVKDMPGYFWLLLHLNI